MYSVDDLVRMSIFGRQYVMKMIRDGDITPDPASGLFNDIDIAAIWNEELKYLI